MVEIERLQAWMEAKGYTMKSLAREMRLSYLAVYTIMVDRKKVTNNFRWRFAQRFGWQEAQKVFSTEMPAVRLDPQKELA